MAISNISNGPLARTVSSSKTTWDADAAAVQVECVALPAMDQLRHWWLDLEARSDRKFFLSWSWIGAWLATINDPPELVVARRHGEIIGLGLLTVRLKTRHRIMPVWTLFLNQVGLDDQDGITIEYNDFLLDRRFEQETRTACLRYLIERQRWSGKRVAEIMIAGMDGAIADGLNQFGRPVVRWADAGSGFVDLSSIRAAGKTYLSSLKSSTARRIRRSMSLYRDQGDIELTSASTVEQALDYFDEAAKLHQARWIARGETGAFASSFFVTFHRELISKALPKGNVELIRITVGGDPLGFLYNFIDRGQVYQYASGFRFDSDNRLKPGLVCHALCIQRHLDNGMQGYDFMGGDQRYKLELGQPGPRIVTAVIQRPHWLLTAERPLRRLKWALARRMR